MNDRELDGMTAMLVVPSYGPIDPACAKDIRVGMMVAANRGLSWAGDGSPDRMGWGAARNMAAQAFLSLPSADGIMWIDSDMRSKPDDISRLLAGARRLGADFMTGTYHQRGGYHNPVFYHFNKEKVLFQPFDIYPEDVIAPIEGCGFGFVWTGRKLIDAIARHPDFDPKDGWFPDKRDSGGFGEDLSFCHLAIKCDIQLYIDTGIQLGHVGEPQVIYKEDFLAKKKDFTEEEAVKSKEAGIWGIKNEESV